MTRTHLQFLALVLTSAPLSAQAQTDTLFTLGRGTQLLQSGQFAEAARVLDSVTRLQPENARSWVLLGVARFKLKEFSPALAATRKAATFEATRPTALYNLGLLHAHQGHPDSAFAVLLEAKATGKIDMTQIGADPDAALLSNDPRFTLLFPTAQEFADPFVEPVTIIREWRGEAAGDQFGWIARNIGDVDGDGINDVTTSAPTNGPGGSRAGKVYVYSTGTGALLWSQSGMAGNQLGLSVEAAGDVNRDGIPDVIAGAPGGERAYVYSGRDGAILHTFSGESKDDGFGTRVSDVGDANGDGHADVVVTAPGNDQGGTDAGKAYVYSGKDGSLLQAWTGAAAGDRFGVSAGGGTRSGTTFILIGAGTGGPPHRGRTTVFRGLGPKPAFVIEPDSTGIAQGFMFISVVGDVDKDGTDDIYSSDFANSARGRATGRIYVYSGRTGKPLHTLTGENAGDGFGIGPADAGDVNDDGYADLVIGAWRYSSAAPVGGKIYLYSGRDGALLRSITGKVPGETLGFDATGLGDVNKDGIADMLVTSAWSAVAGTRSGRVYVLGGK